MDTDARIKALAKFLEVEPDEIEEDRHGSFCNGRGEYLVLTDQEADEKARDSILDSLWAFRPEFILAHSKVDLDPKYLEKIQCDLCEGAGDLVRSLITDLDHFVDDAIKADGRGQFLAPYDLEEHSTKGDSEEWIYIYRVN